MDAELLLEVESSSVTRQTNTQGLTRCETLPEVLATFGYAPDDRIDRRETCVIYATLKKSMESEIDRLAHSAQYDAAKNLRARMTRLRGEFDGLQTEGVRVSHKDQGLKFEEATTHIRKQMLERNASTERAANLKLEQLKDDQLASHAIQTENLERELMRIPRPRVKYSKRCIELIKAEHELIRLSQYDDARKVNAMIKKILPKEERRFHQAFDLMLEERRENLRKEQSKDLVRLDEKLKGLKWNDVRSREKEMIVGTQRIRNHEVDMLHAHALEKKLRPEMSIKPSALWQKRQNFNSTSASLRGQQLFEAAKGFAAKKDNDDAVFCETLTDKHNFALPLLDTVTLRTQNL